MTVRSTMLKAFEKSTLSMILPGSSPNSCANLRTACTEASAPLCVATPTCRGPKMTLASSDGWSTATLIQRTCFSEASKVLGPLLFSLVLHPLALKIETEFPNLDLCVWYLDD